MTMVYFDIPWVLGTNMKNSPKVTVSLKAEESTAQLLDRLTAAMRLLADRTPDWIHVPQTRSDLGNYLLRKGAIELQSNLLALADFWRCGSNRMTEAMTIAIAASNEERDADFAWELERLLLQITDEKES
ncbi:hypothetical protein [Mesoterricola sediminis]|uniref:hypothetical protein n=1 Tax=Mesoterricola sediminis TaxID=2927980 RepID=UPI002930543B|nr:hypothetical protein [Mesoterricola sediminis]